MEHVTIGRAYNEGKIAYAECVRGGDLREIDIKEKSFLLICLFGGTLTFDIGGRRVRASAPSFFCFDETENPALVSDSKADYVCIYFHPMYLNVNMTFSRIRSPRYGDIASVHDLFLLKPFLDHYYVVPLTEDRVQYIADSCTRMEEELRNQRDWYWSCRSRSYFMEIIITLERMYGLVGYGEIANEPYAPETDENPKLRDAILYIEGHFMEPLTLSQVADRVSLNRTSLTALMKAERGMTVLQYLSAFRVRVAKKQLAFTEVPIKEIAERCGFKTVQHFSRVFRKETGQTPADYRRTAVEKRKKEIV